jgi:hypothetical protein
MTGTGWSSAGVVRVLMAIASTVAWMFVSSALIVLNKYVNMLQQELDQLGICPETAFCPFHKPELPSARRYLMVDLGFKYPMTVSGMGMASSAVLSFLCCRVFGLVEAKTPITVEFWLKKIMPVGFFMVSTCAHRALRGTGPVHA